MAGAEHKQIVKHELRGRLVAHGNCKRKRTLFNAVDKSRKDVVRKGDFHLREVLTAAIAIGHSEGDGLATARTLANLREKK